MLLALTALISGIVLLAASADKFVEGSAITARRLGIPPLLVGMLIIGFGSSLPELVVTMIAASEGNSGLALGNAFGSNISNIGLILGVTAILSPITVRSHVLTRELPILLLVTLVCILLLVSDSILGRPDGWILIGLFVCVMSWSVFAGLKSQRDELAVEVEEALEQDKDISTFKAAVYLVLGLIFLVISSRLLVFGGVALARQLGISDVIIGLTVVAIGTSLPELASAIAAVRRKEHDIALGNVIGSNLFNTSIVIGTAGAIIPTALEIEMITRDIPVLLSFTFLLYFLCSSFVKRTPRVSRNDGIALLVCYLAYNAYLFSQILGNL